MIAKRIKRIFLREAKSESPVLENLMSPFQAWVVDLPAAWLISATVIFESGIFSGTAWFAFMFLTLNIILGVPYLLLAAVFSRTPRHERQRSFAILLVVCVLGFVYSTTIDKRATERAQPVVDAIVRFKEANGKYPESLNELLPKYLDVFPTLKPVMSPPAIRYELMERGPELSIDATGAFAHYLYDFEAKKWNFLD